MSVYKNDKPEWFELAVESVTNQTYKPDEIVLFVDGPVGDELNASINKLEKSNKLLRVIRNETNIGLGLTLEKGVLECKNEIIARMDSDDYSMPDRFEKQISILLEKDLDMVGSNVDEFTDSIDEIVCSRNMPQGQDAIVNYAKTRNPFCHPTVMFKKSKVLESGNYLDMHYCEDYYLWIRMLLNNCKVGNIAESLVKMRVNMNMYARRGGYKYFKSQQKLLKFMKKNKFIGLLSYVKSCMIRFTVQVLMPNKLRQKFYMKKLRSK